ncbi:MAG: M3 family oligoendopeptidase [Candidatus Eisenbacteria bacterium]
MATRTEQLPRWDMSSVYSGLDGADYLEDLARAGRGLGELEALVHGEGIGRLAAVPEDLGPVAATADRLLQRFNDLARLIDTLRAFAYAFVTTDSYDKLAAKRMSEIEQLSVRLRKAHVRLQAWVGSWAEKLPAICALGQEAKEHELVLREYAEQSKYLMDARLEDLAAELQLSGGGAMWKLQGTVTSQLKVHSEEPGRSEHLPITKIRNLANDSDEGVRRRAYEAELKAWESVREPVAFSLNCVKGSAITLAKWQGREDVLHATLDRNRIDRETLEALLAAMRDALPGFRRYLRRKAARLGKQQLPWWDLFAPVGKVKLSYTWDQAREYIVTQFGRFDDEMAAFARNAFERRWIDAEPRDGKRGGAFCMRVSKVEESRVLANFDGSFDQMTTVAHELGHAFHNHCQRGLPVLRRGAPMTLAETASIFCETIVFDAALADAPADARLFILENSLMGATQVIVDIYSRYLFETEVIRRRAAAELSADELCEMILDAQRQSYGDALDPAHLHPYMWLLKPHYYYADLHFYNFPYAFGLLFGLGMYAIYQREGAAFVPRYKELLRSTGEGKAAELAGRFGIDIRRREFWDRSLEIVGRQVEDYCGLE